MMNQISGVEPMNLLLVERNADWSQWASVSQTLGRSVLVLVQQGDESKDAFYERVLQRIGRKPQPIHDVLFLRDRSAAI